MNRVTTLKWLSRLALFCAGVLASASLVVAQVTSGALQGSVTDPNGAVIAGAAVKVTNADTGSTKETTTNDQGFYRVTNLTPGDNYTVEISATGFAPYRHDKVAVRLGLENNADVRLTLTAATATVVISSDQALIQSTQNQLSTSYSTQQLTQLPFNGGAIDNLALLTPGVVTPGDTAFSNGVGISANGNRGRSNNFQIDGQDNNDNSVAGPSLFLTNTSAVGELQVITNNFSAEFGRNSGAQINAITKPGTNDFHGELFAFHNNAALDAATKGQKLSRQSYEFLSDSGFSQFDGLASRRLDPYRQNRFGGAIGGPIRRNKAFFFVTYQGDRLRGEAQVNNFTAGALTLTPESIRLAASLGFPGASILSNTINGGGPAFAQGSGFGSLLIGPPVLDVDGNGVPDTLAFGPGNPVSNPVTGNRLDPAVFVNVNGVPTPLFAGEAARLIRTDNNGDQVITREDLDLTSKDRLSLRYIFDRQTFPVATGRFLAGTLFDVPSKNNNIGVTYTRFFSSRLVNEARFNFSRLDVKFGDPEGPEPGPGITLGSFASLNFNLGVSFGAPNNLPQSRTVDNYQWQDTVSSTIGNHALKFGGDIRHQKVSNFFLPNFLGTTTFQGGNPLGGPNVTAGAVPATFPGVSGDPVFFFNPDNSLGVTGARTGFRPTAFENLLLGRPRQVAFALGNPRVLTKQNDFFFFIQDDWRVRPNLTLNLGLRYEVSTTPFNPIIEKVNAREADSSTAIFATSFPLELRTAKKLPIDKNNFGPRVGFAWSPNFDFGGGRFRDGRTVIRGGFGVAYDPSFFNIVLNTVTAAPFAAAGLVTQTPGAAGSVNFPFLPNTTAQLNLTPGTNGGDPRLFNQTRVDPNFHNPYTMSYNFGIQQELWRNTVFEIRYVGSRIVGQFQTINGNPDVHFLNQAAFCLGLDPGSFSNGLVVGTPPATQAAACAGSGFNNRLGTNGDGRIDPNFGPVRLRTNGGTSTYNGMQTRFDTRLSNNLVATVNYTWSKTIDNSSEIFSSVGGGQGVADPQKFFDPIHEEKGLSAFHQKHALSANFIYDLPGPKDQRSAAGRLLGGFQLSGVILAGSGRAYTPLISFGTYDPGFEVGLIGLGALRPFNGNPNAPDGTVAFGFTAACVALFGGPACSAPGAGPGSFIVYNTLETGSVGTVVSPQEALQQARLIYNDFAMLNRLGVGPLTSLEAFSLFKTPFGNVGRNTFSGEPNYNVNLSLAKTIRLTENTRFEFRAEATNILNHRNFGVPTSVMEAAATSFSVGTFQNPGFNNGQARTIRFGTRFIF